MSIVTATKPSKCVCGCEIYSGQIYKTLGRGKKIKLDCMSKRVTVNEPKGFIGWLLDKIK